MSTNDKTNPKLDNKNNDDAIVEVSTTEANAVAGGIVDRPPPKFDTSLLEPDASH